VKRNEAPVDRETLYKQVWADPVTVVAQRYSLSDVGLAKICTKLHIPIAAAQHHAPELGNDAQAEFQGVGSRVVAVDEHRDARLRARNLGRQAGLTLDVGQRATSAGAVLSGSMRAYSRSRGVGVRRQGSAIEWTWDRARVLGGGRDPMQRGVTVAEQRLAKPLCHPDASFPERGWGEVRNRFGLSPPTPLIRFDFPVRSSTDPEDRFGIRSVFASRRCDAEKTVTLLRLSRPHRRSVLVS
jgi:hypothetical protein